MNGPSAGWQRGASRSKQKTKRGVGYPDSGQKAQPGLGSMLARRTPESLRMGEEKKGKDPKGGSVN